MPPPDVSKRLASGRKELLEIGLRNTMVNFRPGQKSLAIVDARSEDVLRLLCRQKKEMTFAASLGRHAKHDDESESEETLDLLAELGATSWNDESSAGEAPTGGSGRSKESVLQTTLTEDRLLLTLLRIQTEARTYLEEQGVNILFLAVGFLHWYEAESSDVLRKAPLLLVPVELVRKGIKNEFRLAFADENLVQNLSLSALLKTDFGLTLPEYEDDPNADPEDLPPLESFFTMASECVSKQQNWKVTPDEIHLGFFSFGKFLMFNDLDPAVWPEDKQLCDHPILGRLLGSGFDEKPFVSDSEHLDDVIQPGDVRFVRDADSSQTVAILEPREGRNLVIQGPPGTGKSQTITNIIAELIGNGKTVLFVAEKMTALEVVQRRLQECHLGDAVLELHSHKSNKAAVLKELDRTLSQGEPLIKDGSRDIESLKSIRRELNLYCQAVNTPIGTSSLPFIRALGRYLNLKREHPDLPTWSFEPMKNWSDPDFQHVRDQLGELARHIREYGRPSLNAFWGSKRQLFSPIEQETMSENLTRCISSLDGISRTVVSLSERLGLVRPATLADVRIACRAAQRAAEAPKLKGISLSSGEWQLRRDSVRSLLAAGRQMVALKTQHQAMLIDHAWEQNVLADRQNIAIHGSKWWRLLSGQYRDSVARLQGLCKQQIPSTYGDRLSLIDAILGYQLAKRTYDQFAFLGEALFGAQWNHERSDWDVLESLSEWIIALHDELGEGLLPPAIINFLSGEPEIGGLGSSINSIHHDESTLRSSILDLVEALQIGDHTSVTSLLDLPVEELRQKLQDWHGRLGTLHQQVRFNALSTQLIEQGLGDFLNLAADWDRPAEDIVHTLDLSWTSGLITLAYSKNPALAQFDTVKQKHLIDSFRMLDQASLSYAQEVLAKTIWERKPAKNQAGEMQVLGHELNKKRRHIPIRKLIDQAGRVIQAIKPVFMMSPMSIANFLPPGKLEFDVVIFDEASQVKSVDAFGALARARQAIVVGDTQQMPPTDFFGREIETDSEDNTTADIESILALFCARGAQERTLNWHYRSRHESLISVSNVEFYERKLVVFPASGSHPLATGLKFRFHPEAIYDRGRTRTNKLEAIEIARAVIDHAENKPDLSLGVVAFSVAQRDLILVELEKLRKGHPELNGFFSGSHPTEPFFVNNLENVQGHERDCILISIGYGRNESGRIMKEFGPIVRIGGERRLNVLISRAKMSMEVFCNFRADELELEANASHGLRALKRFLKYAETGDLEIPRETGKDADSPFEEEVIHALRTKGYSIEPQVGAAGYFIDLTVKDPEFPGRYILAIECDGAAYHSSRSARDRDRLRQGVLEGLGWRFHRIWSTDWFRNPQQEIGRAVQAIESARASARASTPHQPAAAAVRPPEIIRANVSTAPSMNLAEKYKKIELPRWKASQALHEATRHNLLQMIKAVVDQESPVHESEITKRLMKAFGVTRAGNRITETVREAITYGHRMGTLHHSGGFVYTDAKRAATVRDRSDFESSERKIELVAPEELDAGLIEIVQKSFSIDPIAAISATIELMGFGRATGNISAIMQARLSHVLQLGRIKLEGERLVPEDGTNARR
jgi:very-short-patch-repair endonuclease